MTLSTNTLPKEGGIDRSGALASVLCAVHCALSAFLPWLFGAVGLSVLAGDSAEWLFTLIAIALASGGLVLGWKSGQSKKVAALFILGIVGLLASRGMEMSAVSHESHRGALHKHNRLDVVAETQLRPAKKRDGETPAVKSLNPDETTKEPKHVDEVMHFSGIALGVIGGTLLATAHILRLQKLNRRVCQ